ncbi:MAG: four helix bundle protein [Selenomonadaceae bacterium]|nr:four helix bundle protein [Selenomonadaceae bacterium]
MHLQSYKEFTVWQKAMELATEVYHLTRLLPKFETYGIGDQMRRAAVSIPSNIAEGQGRNSVREFIHFLAIARGSQNELETQLLLCVKLDYFKQEEVSTALNLCVEVSKMLNTLIKKIRAGLDHS